MCSVVGYVGGQSCKAIVLEGLARLEYRGYDSAGFACVQKQDHSIWCCKAVGKLENLVGQLGDASIDATVGIGHTRWATHGVPSEANAHPHADCKQTLLMVHNGIIENYRELREQLIGAGHTLRSDTDTEVAVHLLEELLAAHGSTKQALLALAQKLEGAFALIAISQERPDQVMMLRKRSPLCIGIGEGEMFLSSDPLAFAGKTNKILFLPDQSIALVQKDFIELFDFAGKPVPQQVQECTLDWAEVHKGMHQHFMLKEIYEQKQVISKTISWYHEHADSVWQQMGMADQQVRDLERIHLVGAGTSWHAARMAQFFFESIALVKTYVYLASEFRYMPLFPDTNSLHLAISRSGETADTLEAMQLVRDARLHSVALTDVASSTIARESDGFLLTQAGPEVAVASTKAFATQLVALYWLAHRIAQHKGIITQRQRESAQEEVLVAAQVLESRLEHYKQVIVQELAPRYARYSRFIFLGRHISYPFAMEAALKLKEISYIFAQCYPAGELKHGPIALIDQQTPVVLFSHLDDLLYQKLLSNAQEIKARDGHLIVFAFEGQDELLELADTVFVFPRVAPLLGPLAMTGVMQFLMYRIAVELGLPIDKPRNLAKSVTVE